MRRRHTEEEKQLGVRETGGYCGDVGVPSVGERNNGVAGAKGGSM